MWQRISHKFWIDNGYYQIEEVPGWLRATDPFIYSVQIHKNEHKFWAVLYFEQEQDKTAFLLKWV